MSFLAKLFLDDTEYAIQNADILFRQSIDRIQKPNGNPHGGLINIILQSTRDEVFLVWMLAPEKMKNGYVRFYKRDSMSKLADLEFWDCFCVNYYEYFAENTPLTLRLVLSPGIIRFHDVVFEKHWKITDLSAKTAAPISKPVEENPEILSTYFEDDKGEILKRPKKNQTIFLVVKTRDMVGKKIDIDLSDSSIDFEYSGKVLENDLLKNHTVTGSVMKIQLKTIKQR